MYKQNWNTISLKSKTDEAKEVIRKYEERIAKENQLKK
jgi:hypothetical protein